ncbi:MAG: non-canonical purine NTP pyrophosphatase, partial [Solobacterium sp.]|nr:non-canonical purine NTP pyrophosphatase [Solobacterium sp.]
EPRGENGFGYDPIFYLPERGITSAELDPEEKNRISHRAKALRKLEEWLHENR